MTTTHALLIGIDGYPGPAPRPLRGCVNDIDDIQRVLIDQLGLELARITRLVSPGPGAGPNTSIPSLPATRSNIIAALETLAGERVTSDDKVFIYYSGHGASVAVRSDHGVSLREALVPVDAHTDSDGTPRNLLFDHEINRLLTAIARRTSQITVILDACHSAGATRTVLPGSAADRSPRKAEFAGMHSADARLVNEARNTTGILRTLASSGEASAVATACLANEVAYEGLHPDGRHSGNFTRALMQSLADLDPSRLAELRWGSIWHRITSVLAAQGQHPQLQASFARKVFGGPIEEGDTGFSLTREGAGYRLPVGELMGVTRGTIVGVYASEPLLLPRDVDSAEDEAVRLGKLRVTTAFRSHAEAIPVEGSHRQRLDHAVRARVVKPGSAVLTVGVQPPDAEIERTIVSSPFLRLAGPEMAPSVVLKRCMTGEWALTDDLHGTGEGTDAPFLVKAPASEEPVPIVKLLEHYCRYIAPVELARRCQGSSSAVLRLSLLDCSAELLDEHFVVARSGFDPQDPDLQPLATDADDHYEVVAEQTRFCYKVENLGARPLYVTLIESGASGRVSILAGGQALVPAHGHHTFWGEGALGVPFIVGAPSDKPVAIDRVVAIGTTAADKPSSFLQTTRSFAEAVGRLSRDASPLSSVVTEQWASAHVVVRARRAAP